MEKSLVKDLKISWHEATLRIQAAKTQLGLNKKGVQAMSPEEKKIILQKAKTVASSELKGLKKKGTSSLKISQQKMQQDMQKFKEKKAEQQKQQRYAEERQAEEEAFAGIVYRSSMAIASGKSEIGTFGVPNDKAEKRVENQYQLELDRIHEKYYNLSIKNPESRAAREKMEEWEEQQRLERLSIWK